jgi:hypothetical protein
MTGSFEENRDYLANLERIETLGKPGTTARLERMIEMREGTVRYRTENLKIVRSTNSNMGADGKDSGGTNAKKTRNREAELLKGTLDFLKIAHDSQPCPGCKEDIQKFNEFVKDKIASLEVGENRVDQNSLKKLRDVDYVNGLTDVAIALAGVIHPLARILKVVPPPIVEKTLNEDMLGNKKCLEYMRKAHKNLTKLQTIDKDDGDYKTADRILKSFIRAAYFKSSIDPIEFYMYGEIIGIGYKTHLWQIFVKSLVTLKYAKQGLIHDNGEDAVKG